MAGKGLSRQLETQPPDYGVCPPYPLYTPIHTPPLTGCVGGEGQTHSTCPPASAFLYFVCRLFLPLPPSAEVLLALTRHRCAPHFLPQPGCLGRPVNLSVVAGIFMIWRRRCPPYYGVKTAELLGFRRGCPVLSILRHILLPIFVTRVVPVLTMWLAF